MGFETYKQDQVLLSWTQKSHSILIVSGETTRTSIMHQFWIQFSSYCCLSLFFVSLHNYLIHQWYSIFCHFPQEHYYANGHGFIEYRLKTIRVGQPNVKKTTKRTAPSPDLHADHIEEGLAGADVLEKVKPNEE